MNYNTVIFIYSIPVLPHFSGCIYGTKRMYVISPGISFQVNSVFPHTSQKIANRPRNTHSRRNSKRKKKSVPSIFQCPNSISFHNAVHTIIKSTSGNQRDYGSNKKRCRCFFTDSCKNFCIHICNKASHQRRKKNISPEFFSQKEYQPAKETANCCQRQIFLFI